MYYSVNYKLPHLFLLAISLIIIPGINNSLQGQINQTTYSSPILPGAPVYKDAGAFGDRLTITDREGRPFVNNYSGIDGSPFLLEHYCPAILRLSKGKEYQNIQTKLNLYKHEILFIDENNKEIIAADGLVVNIYIMDTLSVKIKTYSFRSGYPPLDKNNASQFYQVLSDGGLQLLRFIKKEIAEQKDVMTGEVRKEFVTHEEYYTFSNGEIKKLKKDKEYVEELMKDQKEKISEYVKEKKINFKNISNLTTLFDYYNSLLSKKGF